MATVSLTKLVNCEYIERFVLCLSIIDNKLVGQWDYYVLIIVGLRLVGTFYLLECYDQISQKKQFANCCKIAFALTLSLSCKILTNRSEQS